MESSIGLLKMEKSTGPNEADSILRLGGETSNEALVYLLGDIWDALRHHVVSQWLCPSSKRNTNCNHRREVRAIPLVTKVLASITLSGLAPNGKSNDHEQQAAFRSGRGCIGQFVTLRQPAGRHLTRTPDNRLLLT